MNFGRWLRGATRIRLDGRTAGNLFKNVATIGGSVMGGGAGIALAGLGNVAGQGLLPGSNIGDMARAGVRGAGTAALSNAARAGLSGLANRGASGAVDTGLGAVDSGVGAAADVAGAGPSVASAAPEIAPLEAGNIAGAQSTLSRVGRTASSVGSFAGRNSNSVAAGLQGLGMAMNAPGEARLRDAEIRRMESMTAADEEERARRRRLEESLEPLQLALAQQLNAPRAPVPSNPYA